MEKVNLLEKFSLFTEHWQPKIVGELNDAYVKIAKIQGEFVWHTHANEDEMFYVVRGQLTLKVEDRELELLPGEFFVVPKGVKHMPVAKEEVWIMMLEPKTTVNTGDVQNERTVADSPWI
ncbi:MAG: cupin domain-containing protein [Firmicutes bacterium]|nr:cupin domain-containing protein [Bacillota bacterium]